MPAYTFDDSEIPCWPLERIRQMQDERLRLMSAYACERTPYWRRKFDDAGVHPADIRGFDDLPYLPFCTKTYLLEDQRRYQPYGIYLAIDHRRMVRFLTTSGTGVDPLLS